jgi:hydrogenase maturation protease
MMDESVGVRAVEELGRRFRFPEDAELLDGGTSGVELLPYLRDRDCLIIIDAIKSGNPPGTVLKVEGHDIPAKFRTRISPHQLGISDLLAVATLSGELPGHVVLFGIEPKIVEVGLGLSEEVKEGFERLLEAVTGELKSIGCRVEPAGKEISGKKNMWGEI